MRFFALIGVAVLLCGCGYRVGGKANLVPKSVETIAVPATSSMSTDYRLGDLLANDIGHELTERTRFQVVRDQSTADAVLKTQVTNVTRSPQLSDPTTGKTTSVQLLIWVNITLTERKTGKVLYSRPGLVGKETYELPTDPHQIVDESGPAFQRIARVLARDVVTAVLEGF